MGKKKSINRLSIKTIISTCFVWKIKETFGKCINKSPVFHVRSQCIPQGHDTNNSIHSIFKSFEQEKKKTTLLHSRNALSMPSVCLSHSTLTYSAMPSSPLTFTLHIFHRWRRRFASNDPHMQPTQQTTHTARAYGSVANINTVPPL